MGDTHNNEDIKLILTLRNIGGYGRYVLFFKTHICDNQRFFEVLLKSLSIKAKMFQLDVSMSCGLLPQTSRY